jgi:hypothetical protein
MVPVARGAGGRGRHTAGDARGPFCPTGTEGYAAQVGGRIRDGDGEAGLIRNHHQVVAAGGQMGQLIGQEVEGLLQGLERVLT